MHNVNHVHSDQFAIYDLTASRIVETVNGRTAATERARKLDFARYPGLSDYIACALEDLQLSEADQACSDERESRDSGTIYSLCPVTYNQMRADWISFATDCAAHIASATEYNHETTLHGLPIERIGSTYWLARCGSGVTFTDDGSAPALEALANYARAHSVECLYFGDDCAVYQC